MLRGDNVILFQEMNDTEHFSQREFVCKDGCEYSDGTRGDIVSPKLLQLLEVLYHGFSSYIGSEYPIYVLEGRRCEYANNHVRDIRHDVNYFSNVHTLGYAAHITAIDENGSPLIWHLYNVLINHSGMGFSYICAYDDCIHVDVSPVRRSKRMVFTGRRCYRDTDIFKLSFKK